MSELREDKFAPVRERRALAHVCLLYTSSGLSEPFDASEHLARRSVGVTWGQAAFREELVRNQVAHVLQKKRAAARKPGHCGAHFTRCLLYTSRCV